MTILTKNRFAFVIRLWNEAAHSNQSDQEQSLELRGSIYQVDSDQLLYFSSLDAIPTLLWQLTGWDGLVRPEAPGLMDIPADEAF